MRSDRYYAEIEEFAVNSRCAPAVSGNSSAAMVARDNGPAFSETAVISAENTCHSNRLDARDHSPQPTLEVRLMGRMGSHTASPTNSGGVDGLTGAARRRFGRGALGAVFAGFCACVVVRGERGRFRRDHWSAAGSGFSAPEVLSGVVSGERASESG